MLDQLALILTGFSIVIGVLSGLWGACALVALGFREKGSPAVAPVSPSAPVTASSEGTVPPHHLVAIAAAVAAVMSSPYRIVNIDAPPQNADNWKVEGRFNTHRVHWGWHVINLPKERK